MSLINQVEAANRLARATASDIASYNEGIIKQGIEEDSFFELLSKQLEEGRSHYNSKVAPELRENYNFYDRAIVDVIIKRKGHIQSKIW